ncbi:MAG: Spy/CpxP family protein refolding chaperone [Hyphomicrobiaceae bacterium]
MVKIHPLRSATVAIAIVAGAAVAFAQQGPGRGPGGGGPGSMGPGMMRDGMGSGWGGGWGMGPWGMHRGMGNGMSRGDCPMFGGNETYADGRLAFLKAELAITEAQKSAWDAYAATLRKNLENMQTMRKAMWQSFEADKTPIERLDVRANAMETRLAALKEMKPALAALYGTFSDEQKKKANEILVGMGCMM